MAINKRFASEEYVNENYAPISHPHSWADSGDKITYGDTLTWDVDLTGKTYESLDMGDYIFYLVHVSDVVPTMEDLQHGGTEVGNEGGTQKTTILVVNEDEHIGNGTELIADMGDVISLNNTLIVKADNVFFEPIGITFSKAGVYFMYIPDMEQWAVSLTINGYNGFPRTEITPIDPKYIKDMYYEIPAVWDKAEIIDDDWKDRATCKLASNTVEWAENNSYRLRIDDVEYTFNGMRTRQPSAATDNQKVYYIGATYFPFNSNMDFSKYPFCLLTTDFENIYAVFEDGSIKHTVEMLKSDAVIHPIPEKYLPDDTILHLSELEGELGGLYIDNVFYGYKDYGFELIKVEDGATKFITYHKLGDLVELINPNTKIIVMDGLEYLIVRKQVAKDGDLICEVEFTIIQPGGNFPVWHYAFYRYED